MSGQDSGFWFLNGKVVTAKEKDAAWKRYQKKAARISAALARMHRRYERETAPLRTAQEDNWNARPYTPWVGRRDERKPVEKFIDSAKRQLETRRVWLAEITGLRKAYKTAPGMSDTEPTRSEIQERIEQLQGFLRNG